METTEAGRKTRPLSMRVRRGVFLFNIVLAGLFFVAGLAGSSLLGFGFFLVPVGILLATLIHELGHAVGAVLAGWRVIVFTAWPFALHIPGRQLVMSKRLSTRDGGGFVFGVPRALDRDTPARWILFVLLGPLFSLTTAAVLLLIAFGPPQPSFAATDYGALAPVGLSPDEHRLAFCFLVALAILNFDTFLNTAVPSFGSTSANDARMILTALRHDGARPGANEWILNLLKFNVRLRDIPDWMYAEARRTTATEGGEPSYHDSLDIARALDAKRVDAAHVRRLVDRYRTDHGDNDWLLTSEVWLALIHEGDLPRAKASFALLKGQSNSAPLLAAVEAAVAAAEGRTADRDKELAKMEMLLKADSPFRNATFRDIRRQIEALASDNRTPSPH